MKDKMVFTGYHGTSKFNKSSIEKNGLRESKDGWLGKGVYFFEDDCQMAIKWAQKRCNSQMVYFIKRYIKVDETMLFDITWPLSKQTKYFFEEKERYIKEMTARGYRVNIDRNERFEGKLIEDICKKKNYSVVRACTYTYSADDDRYRIDCKFANGVELCVKDSKCIYKEGE